MMSNLCHGLHYKCDGTSSAQHTIDNRPSRDKETGIAFTAIKTNCLGTPSTVDLTLQSASDVNISPATLGANLAVIVLLTGLTEVPAPGTVASAASQSIQTIYVLAKTDSVWTEGQESFDV